jgi:predicted permease
MTSTRRTVEDFADEIEAHLALEVERLIADGLSPQAARDEARRRFGNVTRVRERFYESGRLLWWDHFRQDVRDAARRLRRYPVAAIVAVISLAGGIGATTATLAIRDAVFHKPPPLYRAPHDLSRVQVGSRDQPVMPSGSLVPGPLFALWRDAPQGVRVAGASPVRIREVHAADRTANVPVRLVSQDLFAVLGVEPVAGQIREGQAASAVLSHRMWLTLFDGRSEAVGQTIWLDDQPFTVAAVMPERFWFSTMDAPIWLPVNVQVLAQDDLETVARRPPGTSPEALTERLQSGLRSYAAGLASTDRHLLVYVSGIEGTPIGRMVSIALPWVLGAAVLLTLLIACANVAILVIVQWTTRERETALRVALGASRSRMVRSLITEPVLIACLGGMLGVGASVLLRSLIVANAGPTVRMFDLSIDPHILVYSLIVTLLSGLVAGIGPALIETQRLRTNPMRTLGSSERIRQRWRHTLVIAEITITIALLVVTGGLLSTYTRQLSKDLGFNVHPLIALRVAGDRGVPVTQVGDAVAAIPGVAAVAPSTSVPYASFGRLEFVSAAATGAPVVRADTASVGAGFFSTIGVSLRSGRAFGVGESPDAHTAIVSEELASRLFGHQPPIGRRLWVRGVAYEIVGLVAQYSNQALQRHDRDPKLFVPFEESSSVRQADFLVRASVDPASLLNALRQDVKRAAPGTVVTSVSTVDQMIAVAAQEILASTAPLVPLIAIGMLLTTAGVYGVLAFAVSRRAKELALRLAIGATGRDIVGLVVRQSLRLISVGLACGVGATFLASRIVRASGGEGSFLDPAWPAFVIPVLLVLLAAAGAAWIPSRRALRINPAQILRAE